VWKHCEFRYGGYNNGSMLSITSSSPTIEQCTFANARGAAIYVSDGSPQIKDNVIRESHRGITIYGTSSGTPASRPVISGNTITENGLPLSLEGYAFPVFSNNTLTNNAIRSIGVSGSMDPSATRSEIWPKLDIPYMVNGSFTVGSKMTLGLESGVVVKFNNTHHIRVNGILDMQGTSDNPVVFTSWKDDSAGGDTNNDADTTVPSPGDWYYIDIRNSENVWKHCEFRYGGYNNGSMLSITSSSPTIEQCTFANARGAAIYVSGESNPRINLNNFDNCAQGMNNQASLEIDATNNWWDASSGPTHSSNSEGKGLSITGEVDFQPWLDTPYMFVPVGMSRGDVSQNGVVRPYDAALILRHVVGQIRLSTGQLTAADVNGDGRVNEADAARILQFTSGLIPSLKLASPPAVTYANHVLVGLPTLKEESNIVLPVTLNCEFPVTSFYFCLRYDSTSVEILDVLRTTLTEDYLITFHAEGGELRIAGATTHPPTRQGDVLQIIAKMVNGAFPENDGAIELVETRINGVDFLLNIPTAIKTQENPQNFELEQNYPNPFNAETHIRFTVPKATMASVRIYNISGQLARVFSQELTSAGYFEIAWDGRDHRGQSMASGVYIYQLITDESQQIRKMILLR